MKKRLILSLAAIALAATISAQTENLPKDTIDGTVVYKYTVQKSEGLYRISKTFDVTQEELVRLNPKLQTEGLKYGQVIYVPVKSASKVTASSDSQYIKHVVQPKETFYALSKRYGVSVEAIQAANPNVKSETMGIGMTLLIPVKGSQAAAKPEAKAEEKAAPAEKEEKHSGLKTDNQRMQKKDAQLAPTASEQPAAATAPAKEAPAEEAPADEAPSATDTPAEQVADTAAAESETGISAIPLRIAYLLPLQADAVKRDAQMDRFVDFYEGALLAVYEAQQNGQHFDIYTYDIQKSDIGIQQVLMKGEMHNMDAIIGPAYPSQVSYAALYAKQNRIPCVVPFTNKVSGLEHNPYLLQFNPTDVTEAEAAVELLECDKSKVQLVFVDPQANDVPAFVSTLKSKAEEAGFAVAETTMREILNDSLRLVLQKGKKNILVFNAEKYSNVSVVMNKIVSQKGGNDIALFGRYSWKNEKTAIPMVYVSMFHEPSAAKIAAYEALYKRYFGHALSSTNPRYDLLGYDITKSTIDYLLRSQQAATEAEREAVYNNAYNGLQSDIRYERANAEGGRVNTGIKLIWK